jgi:hypothetical protein
VRLVLLATAGLAAGCAPLADTPAQDRAWAVWQACRGAVASADVLSVDVDGRLRIQMVSGYDRGPILACLRGPAGDPALPEPVFTGRPVGP